MPITDVEKTPKLFIIVLDCSTPNLSWKVQSPYTSGSLRILEVDQDAV